MIQTVVRVYNPTPEDVEVRDPGHVDGELVVDFGPNVSLQGHASYLRACLTLALVQMDRVEKESVARRAVDEDTDERKAATEFLVEKSIDGGPF